LRETVAAGLARADLIMSIGDASAQAELDANWPELEPVPRLTGVIKPLQMGMDWTDAPVFAFAGIGHPEKFFQTLTNLGADLRHGEALTDHQPLTEALLNRLARDATAHGPQLATTEKDAVRLPPGGRQKVLTVPVWLQVGDWGAINQSLKSS